jgi:hypothetical protein
MFEVERDLEDDLIFDAPQWFDLAFWDEELDKELEEILPLGVV